MSEDRRLRDKLTKLAADDEGHDMRRLLPGAGGDMTRAILEEIDETILGRTLSFHAPDGATLRIEVANRRLLAFTGYPKGLAPGPEEDKLTTSLAHDDEDALVTVAEAIARFAGDATGLTVRSEPLARSVGPGMLGRSATALARTLGIDLYDRPAPVQMPDPRKGFEAGLGRLALAVAVVSGADPSAATGPDADAVGRLSAMDRDHLARISAELGPETARSGRFLLFYGGEEALFIGQKDASRAVVALVPSEHAGTVAALWKATRDLT